VEATLGLWTSVENKPAGREAPKQHQEQRREEGRSGLQADVQERLEKEAKVAKVAKEQEQEQEQEELVAPVAPVASPFMQPEVFVGMVTSVKYSSEMWSHWLAHYTSASLGLDRVPKANFLVILHSREARPPR
jgi:hypothetical protein